MARYFDDIGIPYPPVFRDWRHDDRRVVTTNEVAGVGIEMTVPGLSREQSVWQGVQLTKRDATLLAASLLRRAGHEKLAKKAAKAARRDSDA